MTPHPLINVSRCFEATYCPHRQGFSWMFWHLFLMTSLKQNPCWEANCFSASQEIPRILWNQAVYCRIYKCPSRVPLLTQIHPVHALHPMSWRSILILSHIYIRVFQVVCFPQVLPTKSLYAPLLTPIRATCSTRLIFLDLITPIMSSKEYRSLSYSVCSFLHSPVTSSLLGPKYSPQHPILKHPQPTSLPQYEWPYVTIAQNNRQIVVLYISLFTFLDSKLEDKRICIEW